MLSNGRFLFGCDAIGFQNLARYGLLVWVPVYFLGEDWKLAGATNWPSVFLPVSMALGALANGWIFDRFFQWKQVRGHRFISSYRRPSFSLHVDAPNVASLRVCLHSA